MVLLRFLCVLLAALSAQAKVVKTFQECSEFFYNNAEPAGMSLNTVKICQRYGNILQSRFASLYSEHHRIPLYSAYIFRPGCSNSQVRRSMYFIEPQLSGYSTETMSPEDQYDVDTIKKKQAINGYYSNTGYDRGHLNPKSFQCSEGLDATFTLTNSAPMDAGFYRIHWRPWEDELKSMLTTELHLNPAATPYLITGTVPQKNYRIPRKEETAEGEQREWEKVTVPSHFWTALCFKDPTDNKKSFSLGYMGQNQPDSFIRVMSVQEMTLVLGDLYQHTVSIFTGDCFSDNQKSQEMINTFYKRIQLPSTMRLQMAPDVLKIYYTAIYFNTYLYQQGISRNKARVTQMSIIQSFDSIESFAQQVEKMKYLAGTACLLTKIGSKSSGMVKRSLSRDSESVECLLVPEKSRLTKGSEDYCTSPCLYQKEKDSYWCYLGNTQVQCSPLYSAITDTEEKCKADHPCGLYNHKFYWCYKEAGSWGYCSPPIWQSKAQSGFYCRNNRACAKYGSSYNWCHTYQSKTEQPCCTQDDCFSAVNSKTCKPDHPCGLHGETYLWCYTTDGSWDRCCKDCLY